MSRTLNRRQLLMGLAALSASTLMPWATRLWAGTPDDIPPQDITDFLSLSERLTMRPQLNSRLAGRAYQGLLDIDADFPRRMRQLIQAMDEAQLTDMRQFKAFAEQQPDALTQTAIDIIAAWYLGHTGTVQGHSATDDTHFVTYVGALMYQPTLDATVIPTYSRGHTNYWVSPPATIATD